MLIRSLVLFGFALILGACGEPYHSIKPESSAGSQSPVAVATGYESYTISGNPEIYEELRDNFREKQTDTRLARSIKKIRVVKQADGSFEINVLFDEAFYQLQKLVFKGSLAEVETERYGEFQTHEILPENFYTKFSLGVRCRSADCTLMEMHLKEISNSSLKSEAVWMYQQKETNARFIESDKGGLDKLKFKPEDTKSVQTSVVVIDGPAYSVVSVSAKDAKPEDTPLLVVETDLVNTQQHAKNVKSIQVNGIEEVTAVLQGNDPNTGSLMLDIEEPGSDHAVRVIFDNRKEGRQLQRVHLGIADGRLNPNGISPEIDAYTAALDKYASNPEVQKRIELWLTSGKACPSCRKLSRDDAVRFLTNLPAVNKELLMASRETNVSPEKAYVLAIESAFLKDPASRFPIQVYNGPHNSTAAGPWMITNTTGHDILRNTGLPYKILSLQGNKPGRTLNPADDRNFFYESTIMAFSYYASMPEALSHDPGLQIVAYFRGPGKIRELADRHGSFKSSLYDIAGMHSFDDADHYADYAYSMIALRFIGMNPELHGLDITELSEVPAAVQSKLRNPIHN